MKVYWIEWNWVDIKITYYIKYSPRYHIQVKMKNYYHCSSDMTAPSNDFGLFFNLFTLFSFSFSFSLSLSFSFYFVDYHSFIFTWRSIAYFSFYELYIMVVAEGSTSIVFIELKYVFLCSVGIIIFCSYFKCLFGLYKIVVTLFSLVISKIYSFIVIHFTSHHHYSSLLLIFCSLFQIYLDHVSLSWCSYNS